MGSTVKHLLLLIGTLAVVVQGVAQQTPPSTGGVIRGMVRVSATGGPVPKASMTISLSRARTAGAQPIEWKVLTDAGGRFEFRGLPMGTHIVRAERDGYLGDRLGTSARAIVRLDSGRSEKDIVLTLMRGAVISGKVVDADGNPVVGLYVVPLRSLYVNGRPNLVGTGVTPRTAITNDRGEYRVFWAEPGEYFLRTGRPPLQMAQGSYGIYYPAVLHADEAVPIVVKEGQETAGIDIKVPQVKRYTVTGEFARPPDVDPDGRVSLVRLERRGEQLRDSELTSGEFSSIANRFTVSGLPAGSYDLYMSLRDSRADDRTIKAMLEVRDADVSGVVANVLPNTVLTGHIVVNGTIQNPRLETTRISISPQEPVLVGNSITGASTAAGDITFPSAPAGTYRLAFDSPPGMYVADVRYAGRSILDVPQIDLDGGAQPLEVGLSTGGGTIRGSAPASSTVRLIPNGPRRANRYFYRNLGLNPDGQFAAADLPPGEYKLFAWAPTIADAVDDPKFLQRYETRGYPITIRPGTSITDIRLDVLR